jgi:hypothetical protein
MATTAMIYRVCTGLGLSEFFISVSYRIVFEASEFCQIRQTGLLIK